MVPLPSLAEIPQLQALQSQVRRLWAAQTVVVLARIAAFGSLGRPTKGGKSLQDQEGSGVLAPAPTDLSLRLTFYDRKPEAAPESKSGAQRLVQTDH